MVVPGAAELPVSAQQQEGQCSPELQIQVLAQLHSPEAEAAKGEAAALSRNPVPLPRLNSQLLTRNRRAGASSHEALWLYLNGETLSTAVLSSL